MFDWNDRLRVCSSVQPKVQSLIPPLLAGNTPQQTVFLTASDTVTSPSAWISTSRFSSWEHFYFFCYVAKAWNPGGTKMKEMSRRWQSKRWNHAARRLWGCDGDEMWLSCSSTLLSGWFQSLPPPSSSLLLPPPPPSLSVSLLIGGGEAASVRRLHQAADCHGNARLLSQRAEGDLACSGWYLPSGSCRSLQR